MDKQQLRKSLIKARKAMSQKQVDLKSAQIAKRLFAMDVYKKAKAVLVYADFANEVKTQEIIKDLESRGVAVYLPVVVDEQEFVACKRMDTMQKNRYGIEEPVPIETALKGSGKIDLVICPGVGFDANLNRLGHGKGYYDRFLNGQNMTKIGLAYDAQIVDTVDATKTDVPMDWVITESKSYRR